jgi:hypothetical protein
MRYACCEPQRLEIIKRSGSANGIEYVEVRDHAEPVLGLRQRTLFVRLLRPGFSLTPDNVLIDGGERQRVVAIEWVAAADALPAGTDPLLVDGISDLPTMLVVRTTQLGDFSTYTLHLRAGASSDQPPPGFDPILSQIAFSFKVECTSDFDCAEGVPCPSPTGETPVIDYLAKDYTGFRRLMLDRLDLLAPGWSERSSADVGVALVELLAYAADNLSYRQDAIANEAYLATAHKRVSVRRHARLVDYALHDGCNARAFVRIGVSTDVALPQSTQLLTAPGSTSVPLTREVEPDSKAWKAALAGGSVVFETAHPKDLFASLTDPLVFHAWGDRACCLPRGATSATLAGLHPDLQPGDLLLLQEVVSPTTFNPADADPAKRWVVRLTEVRASVDPSGRLFDTPPVDAPADVTELAWSRADALPFPLCISVEELPGEAISVAFGNIVLVDHGQTVTDPAIAPVPTPRLKQVAAAAVANTCSHVEAEPIPVRFRPALKESPVTHGFDLVRDLRIPPAREDDWFPATALLVRDPRDALPLVSKLQGDPVVTRWNARRDLLNSEADAPDFVVETENDGLAVLRFGDDTHGRRPNEGTVFTATYRIGNGVAGNVGADSIAHIVVSAANVFTDVTNPLPATGGIDPEPLDAVRRDAPEAFRTQERAVTAADYAAATERRDDIQRAAATFRWTGSWHTVFVTADRLGGNALDTRFKSGLRRHLERFRMAGYDIELDGPRYVALDITLHICVLPGHFRSQVVRAVQRELGAGTLPDGRRAVFHPDNFTFGEAVYLSRIVAAAQAVEGVEAVWVQKFERFGQPDARPLETGVLPMGRLEIAQLANNPNFRERGRLTLEAGGGK